MDMIALSRIKMDNNKHEMTTVTLNVKVRIFYK